MDEFFLPKFSLNCHFPSPLDTVTLVQSGYAVYLAVTVAALNHWSDFVILMLETIEWFPTTS